MRKSERLFFEASKLLMAMWLVFGGYAIAQENPVSDKPAPSPGQILPVADQPLPATKPKPILRPEDEIAIAPSRLELVMPPGTEKTVVINLIYHAASNMAQPTRVVSYLGDWNLSPSGEVQFHKAGTLPNSASPWIIHSPVEMTVSPGKIHHARVTVSVPKDATPGDHLAALFFEPRPDNLKTEEHRKQLRMKFRLAAIFYIMVPQLTRQPALTNLKAESKEEGILVTPRFKNEGNSHVRPTYSVKVADENGAVVAELPEVESLPVLAESEVEIPVLLNPPLPPGKYVVSYRVGFEAGGPITEGQTELLVRAGKKPITALTQKEKVKTGN